MTTDETKQLKTIVFQVHKKEIIFKTVKDCLNSFWKKYHFVKLLDIRCMFQMNAQ